MKPARHRASPAEPRRARRMGALQMIDHLLRGAPAPANPYRRDTKSAAWFDWGVDQARRFADPLMETRP